MYGYVIAHAYIAMQKCATKNAQANTQTYLSDIQWENNLDIGLSEK